MCCFFRTFCGTWLAKVCWCLLWFCVLADFLSSLPSDDASSARSKCAKYAVPPTSNFVSRSPVVVRFVVLSLIFFDVSFELFLLIFCSELLDTGNDDEEEGSKTMGKRQYSVLQVFFFVFWVWLLTKLSFIGIVRQKRRCICPMLPLPSL